MISDYFIINIRLGLFLTEEGSDHAWRNSATGSLFDRRLETVFVSDVSYDVGYTIRRHPRVGPPLDDELVLFARVSQFALFLLLSTVTLLETERKSVVNVTLIVQFF